MSHRSFVGVFIVIALAASPVFAQTKKWTPPRTPWGDPDIQGSYDNTSENGTPLEKPEIFEGRKLEDVKGEELLALKKEAQKRTIDNFQGPLHAPEGWWQRHSAVRMVSSRWRSFAPRSSRDRHDTS